MKNVDKRIRDLEDLVFRLVLQTKAESMAIRDILLEKNFVSPERWEELVEEHKKANGSFKVIKEMEARATTPSTEAGKDKESEHRTAE